MHVVLLRIHCCVALCNQKHPKEVEEGEGGGGGGGNIMGNAVGVERSEVTHQVV